MPPIPRAALPLVAMLLFPVASSTSAAPPARLPAYIARAAADPARAAQAPDDARRHGPEIVAFAGLKPGGKVLDLIPGGAYWTRLFARVVGPRGHVYGIWPKPYADEAHRNVVDYDALSKTPGFANVTGAVQPADSLAVPERVDLVFTAQNYHDYPDKFMGNIDPAVLNKAVFAALRPGGVYLVIDHVAAAGSGMRDTDTLHRIDPAIVKKQVIAAGFRFVGESRLLANPADDHAKPVFDKTIRGRTDQFIYKFVKPMR
ncbi:MAG: methyltransferase [Sphingomonas sp.]|jgi:predicted methyltransferase|uniref:class I SAM-dependent methyltransferase n=1 Tax=Sphingomonas sp. TaxID=28214 RepID=UPI003565FBCA